MLSLALAVLARLQAPDPIHPDLADLSARWKSAMDAWSVSAFALAVVEGDEVVHCVTLGRRDPARAEPVTKDTLFYIASSTKPYVAFALAQLAEQGKVDLDAPVKRYLPRFRLADAALTEAVTVRDLLCHRHGLNNGPIVLLDAYTGEITEDRYYHFLSTVESPGHVAYSNVHFTLAGRVIEAVSGESWRDYLAAHVFTPAGMTRTTGYADWMYGQEDVAVPTWFHEGRIQPTPVRKTDRTMHAAGGLGTSLSDFARWIRLQLGRGMVDGRRLLSERATEASWELASSDRSDADFGGSDGYALGWQRGHYRGHLELRHGGGYVGASSFVCFLPELGLGVAVLASGDFAAGALCRLAAFDVRERLLADDEVQDLRPSLTEQLRSRRMRDEEQRAVTPKPFALSLPLARCAGVYRNEWYGTLTLSVDGERLRARLGDLDCPLFSEGKDALRIDSDGPFGGVATLEVADGRVAAVVVDLDGPVRFAR